MAYLQKHYEFQVKQLKPDLQSDALNFLKEKGSDMMHKFNKEMHTLVLHFQDYRLATDAAVQTNHDLWMRLVEAEKTLALEGPVREAQYGMNEKTPLSLFNPLVAKLKLHI